MRVLDQPGITPSGKVVGLSPTPISDVALRHKALGQLSTVGGAPAPISDTRLGNQGVSGPLSDVGSTSTRIKSEPTVISTGSSGFDWASTGVGLAAFAGLLLAVGSAIAVRRNQSRKLAL